MITSNPHLVTEGLYLLKLNQSPYAGDVYHQPPLVLLLFYGFQNYPIITKLFFILLDIFAALLIRQITSLWQRRKLAEISGDEKVLELFLEISYQK
jgi:phosphatidylinositol glycan class U